MLSSVTAALSLLLTATDPSFSSGETPVESPSHQAAQPPVAEHEPAWSIGAGLTLGQVGGLFSLNSLSSLTSLTTFAPGASVFLEHRSGPRSFLLLDLSGAYQSNHLESGSTGNARQRSLAADIGLRYLLTAPDALVDVSVLALVNGSLSDSTSSSSGGLSSVLVGQSQWSVGASAGLVVERKLVPGLFVRISTPVVYASNSRSKTDYVSMDSVVMSGFGVGLQLAPRLELRLAF